MFVKKESAEKMLSSLCKVWREELWVLLGKIKQLQEVQKSENCDMNALGELLATAKEIQTSVCKTERLLGSGRLLFARVKEGSVANAKFYFANPSASDEVMAWCGPEMKDWMLRGISTVTNGSTSFIFGQGGRIDSLPDDWYETQKSEKGLCYMRPPEGAISRVA